MHLVDHFRLIERAQVLMAPTMGSYLYSTNERWTTNSVDKAYLVSISMHSPYNIRPASLFDIDLTLAQIVSCDEEGGFGTVCREYIKKMRCVIIWTVIERQSHCTSVLTLVDSRTIIRDIANEWTGYVERRFAQRSH